MSDNMEVVFNAQADKSLIALKQACVDPMMTTSVTDFELFSYLSGESVGQALDETVDLDVIPQASYPSASPSYESEGVPSPPGMDEGTSPVSTGGDIMSELQDFDFSDLLTQDDGTDMGELLKDAFEPKEESKPTGNATNFTVLEIPDDQSVQSDDSEESTVTVNGARRVSPRKLTKKAATISVVKPGEMPKRTAMSGPKVVRVANRVAKQMPVVELDDEVIMDKNRKNAVQARINREKKKAYIADLEGQVSELQGENKKLRYASSKLLKEKDSLAEEVAYLKSVLANDSALSGLLKNIGNTSGINLSTSFTSRKRAASTEHDHDYGTSHKKVKTSSETATGGICLHVNQENVSLEFCPTCARMAKESS